MNHLKPILFIFSLLIIFGCTDKPIICPEEKNIKIAIAPSIDESEIDSCYLTVINISKSDTLEIQKDAIIDTSLMFVVFDEYLLTAELLVKPATRYKGNKRIIIDNKTEVINIYVTKDSALIDINIIIDTTTLSDTIYYNGFENPLKSEWETNYARDSLHSFKEKYSLHSNPDGVKLNSYVDAILDINLTKTIDPVLSFWSRNLIGYCGSSVDIFLVYISKDLGETWEEIYRTSTYNQEFGKVTRNLASYRGSNVKIMFRYYTNTSHCSRVGGGIWIDEVLIVESPKE